MDKTYITLDKALELLNDCDAVLLDRYVFIPEVINDDDADFFLWIEDFDLYLYKKDNQQVEVFNNDTLIFTDDENNKVDFILLTKMNFNK